MKKGVIVVTINYRLGFLGFFAQSAIDAEGHLKTATYGSMDQQFALGWVREEHRELWRRSGSSNNLRRVSGGSVYAQLASPLVAGMFRGAISESGSYAEFQNYFSNIATLTVAETTGTTSVPSGSAIADSVVCTDQTAACLRAVPASTMVAVEPFPLYPFVDGTLLTQTMSAAFASGEFNRVPVISGTNHDEYRLFVALGLRPRRKSDTDFGGVRYCRYCFVGTGAGVVRACFVPIRRLSERW